jgi:hypothetical protein
MNTDKCINFVLDNAHLVIYKRNKEKKMFKAYASSESIKNEEEKKPIVTSSANNNSANGK